MKSRTYNMRQYNTYTMNQDRTYRQAKKHSKLKETLIQLGAVALVFAPLLHIANIMY